MIRLNRMRHLQRAMEATDRGEWHDLGKATSGLRDWLHNHGLVEGRPNHPDKIAWIGTHERRRVRITDKGRAALAEAKKEYARHSNPTRADQRKFAALKEELAGAFGITGGRREWRSKEELAEAFGAAEKRVTPVEAEPPWPWQDWLAEQWGARSFRFRVLAERS